MAFESDDLQEKAWIRWFGRGAGALESKRRVAGGALHVDLAIWGRVSFAPLDRFLPAGLLAVENKAPGSHLSRLDLLRFAARVQLLLEREAEEGGRMWAGEHVSGLMVGAAVAEELTTGGELTPVAAVAGLYVLPGRLCNIYVWGVDALDDREEHVAWVLYFGSEARAWRLLQSAPPAWAGAYLARVAVFRRALVRRYLEERRDEMAVTQLDIRGAVEDLGIKRVISEVGLGQVIKEVGLGQVIKEVGLDQVIKEVGLDQVIKEVGLDQVIKEVGLDQVIEEVGLGRVIEKVGLDRVIAETGHQAIARKLGAKELRRLAAEIDREQAAGAAGPAEEQETEA
ncbi:MAG: hypothetical protein HYV63_27565 [Candidatus Schekmanbacteria bacterium]|nr:hypothetical protein [Candidatus Schekmanbacteria bacterium]